MLPGIDILLAKNHRQPSFWIQIHNSLAQNPWFSKCKTVKIISTLRFDIKLLIVEPVSASPSPWPGCGFARAAAGPAPPRRPSPRSGALGTCLLWVLQSSRCAPGITRSPVRPCAPSDWSSFGEAQALGLAGSRPGRMPLSAGSWRPGTRSSGRRRPRSRSSGRRERCRSGCSSRRRTDKLPRHRERGRANRRSVGPPRSYNWAVTREELGVTPQHTGSWGPSKGSGGQGPGVMLWGGQSLERWADLESGRWCFLEGRPNLFQASHPGLGTHRSSAAPNTVPPSPVCTALSSAPDRGRFRLRGTDGVIVPVRSCLI